MPMLHSFPLDRRSFTLIELLIVIAVVAVLSVVVVLVLNPAELLKQARDSNRLADMETLNKALTLYLGDRGGSLGTASTTYFSLIDPAATSTAGTNCASLGLVAPTSWNYHCAASSTARKLDGTGWIPLNFSAITFSPPFGALPLDPTNTSSSGLFYMYVPGTTTYALAATLNSSKYLASKAGGDGGVDPARIETGSNLALVAEGEGLIGWWKLDETSSPAVDSSGNSNTGTWGGSPTATTTCKVGTCLNFAGYYVDAGSSAQLNFTGNMTLTGWLRLNASPYPNGGTNWTVINNELFQSYGFILRVDGASARLYMRTSQSGASTGGYANTALSNATWYHFALTKNGTSGVFYVNGVNDGTVTLTNPVTASRNFFLGNNGQGFEGTLDDVRAYSRPLTAAEVAAIYDAQK
jgi:prepilin-type N-terminal cleavage/methylation domain-containing protein